jgi:hypothetical protein
MIEAFGRRLFAIQAASNPNLFLYHGDSLRASLVKSLREISTSQAFRINWMLLVGRKPFLGQLVDHTLRFHRSQALVDFI